MTKKFNQQLSSHHADLAHNVSEVRHVTLVSMLLNVLLSSLKIGAGLIGSSQAIVADGIHSLSDTTTDAILFVGVSYWSAPPDQCHPHGHRRIETLITVLIGILLSGVALSIGYYAVATIKQTSRPVPPGLLPFFAAVISIICKEWLYHWNVKIGKQLGSSAVIANAWHHRSDGFSSIPAALAVAGANFFPHWFFLDQIGAVVVSLFILKVAWEIAWPALLELTDSGADSEAYEQIEKIGRSTEGVLDVHKCRTRRHGYGLLVDLHIQVQPNLTVQAGHEISKAVKQRLLLEGPNIIDVIVHLEPFEEIENTSLG